MIKRRIATAAKRQGAVARSSKSSRRTDRLLAEAKDALRRLEPLFAMRRDTPSGAVDNFHAYPDFKAKVAAEGVQVWGTVRFQYENAAGEISRRTVDLLYFYPNGWPVYIVGFCHLRKEPRTFAIHQMRSIYDLSALKRIEQFEGWLLDQSAA